MARRKDLTPHGPAAANRDKTHCANGHAFEGDNLVISGGQRKCRTCIRESTRRRRHRDRLEDVPRRSRTTTAELVRKQRNVDGRRTVGFVTFRERAVAVGHAYVAYRRGEEGAGEALRQAYVDVASVCLECADALTR